MRPTIFIHNKKLYIKNYFPHKITSINKQITHRMGCQQTEYYFVGEQALLWHEGLMDYDVHNMFPDNEEIVIAIENDEENVIVIESDEEDNDEENVIMIESDEEDSDEEKKKRKRNDDDDDDDREIKKTHIEPPSPPRYLSEY